ncbi:hypothetical protein, partial [Paenibacillus tyrfis]
CTGLVRQTSACFLEGVVPPRKEVVEDKASASKHLVDQRHLRRCESEKLYDATYEHLPPLVIL